MSTDPSKTLILALDIGTSSVRAALYHHGGNVVPGTLIKKERRLALSEDGAAEIDAELAFKEVVRAIDEVLNRSADAKGTVTQIAAAVFWHSLLGIDSNGRPTTTVLSWADTRSSDQVPTLRKRLDDNKIHDRTGARFHSSYWPAKLLWLRKELPEHFRATERWISLSDYVLFRLTGELSTSVSMASATGMFNQRSCDWDPEMQQFLKLKPSSLPSIAGDGQSFTLRPRYAKRWPQLAASRMWPAIGDGAANNIGTNCLTGNRAALMIGTSGAMRVAYKGKPPNRLPSGLWCYRIDRKNVIVGGAVSDGGGLYDWLKKNLRVPNSDIEIEPELAKRPPTRADLIFMPFLAGERSTGFHLDASGALIGLHSTTDAIDIMKAALESVAYRIAEIFSQLRKLVTIDHVVASGGALRDSPAWTQIVSNVLGIDLLLTDANEASLRGAALYASDSIENVSNRDNRASGKMHRVMFDPEGHKAYKQSLAAHRKLYRQMYTR